MMRRWAPQIRPKRLLDLPAIRLLAPGAKPVELVSYFPRQREAYAGHELQTKRWLVENVARDWQIFDIGANVGAYAVLISRLAPEGRVFAFEPAETREMLKRNLDHGGCDNVTPLAVALGAHEDERGTVADRDGGRPTSHKLYSYRTIDGLSEELGLTRLDCLRIDVGGFALDVLRGGERTLERFDPWIVVQLGPTSAGHGPSVADALTWLAARNYCDALVLDANTYVLRRQANGRLPAPSRPSITLTFETRPVFVDDRLAKEAPANWIFEKEPTAHGRARVDGLASGGWRIVVPGPPWSYAASWPLSAKREGMTGGLVIEADLSVSGATVGLGCVNQDMTAYEGEERPVEPGEGIQKIEITIEEARKAGHLVLRNADKKGATGTVELLCLDAAAAGRVASFVNPLLDARKRKISLAEIEAALVGVEPARTNPPPDIPALDIVPVEELGTALDFDRPCLPAWKVMPRRLPYFRMELDEAASFSYLYANHRPRRHLEFGTWEGFGVVLCARACDAEIWTINLPEGETNETGRFLYDSSLALQEMPEDLRKSATPGKPTDAGEFIGWRYRVEGYADRVHQILCDSREFDETAFEPGFFDSVLIDGGHGAELVTNDTDKAIVLLRPGGLMIWHDFCPDAETLKLMAAPRGVVRAVIDNWTRWRPAFDKLFWIRPSWTLIGVKALSS